MPIQSINPFNNQLIQEYNEHSDQEIEKALAQAEATYEYWRQVTFAKRSERMYAAARQLQQNKGRYAQLMTDEMGKVKKEAIAEVEKCASACEYYAEHAEQFLTEERLSVPDGEAYIAYDPIGPVLAVMPWNFPFWQVIRFAAPNLMAGNVGILKHASNVSGCALALEEIFREAGFPEGAFQTLLISTDKVGKLLEDQRIKAATLTGSERAGSSVAQIAGNQIKKTVLELGGSDPFIVLADADVDQAAEIAVKARMINCGQSCIAAKRFVIHQAVYNDFMTVFMLKMQQLKQGDPNEETTDYGPMARTDLAGELLGQVKESVTQGARVLLGGDQPDKEGAFLNATVLTNITPGMPAYDEELFGPVASIFPVNSDDEAVRVANDSRYGLGGSVWTQDINRGKDLVRQIESGAVYINKMMASHPAVPFGGIKLSGYGRELSYLGIREFVNQKTVWIS
ncbi:MAG: NAD-dependent succinate-semialdehyde dehydrogenase [Bacteroidota bacterium]